MRRTAFVATLGLICASSISAIEVAGAQDAPETGAPSDPGATNPSGESGSDKGENQKPRLSPVREKRSLYTTYPTYGKPWNGKTERWEDTVKCIPGGTWLQAVARGRPSDPNETRPDVVFVVASSTKDKTDGEACKKAKEGEKVIEVAEEGDRIKLTPLSSDMAVAYEGGFTWGALVVPYKYQLTGKNEFGGQAAIGTYLGYRVGTPLGVELTPIAFAGLSQVEVRQNVNGTDTMQNLSSLSAGLGLTATVYESFQVGVVVGIDHVDESANYEYNDKPWIAAQIGFAFGRSSEE